MMKRIAFIATTTFAFIFASTASSKAAVYQLVNYATDQNSHTLSGTITTDGTIGVLNSSNIVDASVTVTGPDPFDFTLNGVFLTGSTVIASSTDLTIGSGSRFAISSDASFTAGAEIIEWDRRVGVTDNYEGRALLSTGSPGTASLLGSLPPL